MRKAYAERTAVGSRGLLLGPLPPHELSVQPQGKMFNFSGLIFKEDNHSSCKVVMGLEHNNYAKFLKPVNNWIQA